MPLYIFHSRKWMLSETKDIRQGDFFFTVGDDGKQSAVMIAKCCAYQKAHPKTPGKKIWTVDLEEL